MGHGAKHKEGSMNRKHEYMTKRMSRSRHHNKYIHIIEQHMRTRCCNNHAGYLQAVNPRIAISTAVPVLQLYSDEATDPRVHLPLSLPSITSLIAAVRLNLIMDGKGTSSDPSASSAHTESLTEPSAAPFNRKHKSRNHNVIGVMRIN